MFAQNLLCICHWQNTPVDVHAGVLWLHQVWRRITNHHLPCNTTDAVCTNHGIGHCRCTVCKNDADFCFRRVCRRGCFGKFLYRHRPFRELDCALRDKTRHDVQERLAVSTRTFKVRCAHQAPMPAALGTETLYRQQRVKDGVFEFGVLVGRLGVVVFFAEARVEQIDRVE